jgi:hypothetical protein
MGGDTDWEYRGFIKRCCYLTDTRFAGAIGRGLYGPTCNRLRSVITGLAVSLPDLIGRIDCGLAAEDDTVFGDFSGENDFFLPSVFDTDLFDTPCPLSGMRVSTPWSRLVELCTAGVCAGTEKSSRLVSEVSNLDFGEGCPNTTLFIGSALPGITEPKTESKFRVDNLGT